MTPLLKKLNYKDQQAFLIVNAPGSFQDDLKEMKSLGRLLESNSTEIADFAMLFSDQLAHLESAVPKMVKRMNDDTIFWVCYPKKTSKKYQCDFNRDNGFQSLGDLGFEGVRQVAIDEDWSALRFKKANQIKQITRRASFAISKEGKSRTSQKDE